jgi:hypothetical protein
MLKDAMTICIAESLDAMDTFDAISDVSEEFGDNPLDNLLSTMSEAETVDYLFPTELNSKYEDLLNN